MAIEYASERNILYLSIYDGRMKYNVKPDTQGAEKRINKNAKEVWEMFVSSVSGHLVGIEKQVSEEYQDSWVIKLHDRSDDSTVHLRIPYSGRQADGFLRRLPNMDLEKPIKIAAGSYNEKQWLTVSQEGSKLDYYWTQENPGNLPQMVQMVVKGKEVWDDTEKMKYLERYVNEKVIPKIQSAKSAIESALPEGNIGTPNANDVPPAPEEDDLPF